MLKRRFVLGLGLLGLLFCAAGVEGAEPSPAAPQPGLHVGDTVPAFKAQGLDGATRSVDYPKGTTTMVVFFLSSCPTCHKMIPLWNGAFARRPKNMAMVGIMLDQAPPGFFDVNPTAFPVVRSPGKELTDAFKMTRVPYTVRVGPGGRVEGAAVGLLDGIRMGELFRP
jgi:hypothetical protein